MDRNDTQSRNLRNALFVILLTAVGLSLFLLVKSATDFSHSGPQIREEVLRSYLGYVIYALARLAFWAAMLAALMAASGMLVYGCLITVFDWRYRWYWGLFSAFAGIGVIAALQFSKHLLYIPSSISASFNYRVSRLYPLWEVLTPMQITIAEWLTASMFLVPVSTGVIVLFRRGQFHRAVSAALTCALLVLAVVWAEWAPDPAPAQAAVRSDDRPNVLMIGSDTLRADRLGIAGYHRKLTPHIDTLAKQGAYFAQCLVPLARTGPSMVSLMTGTWPHTHGVRSNYVPDDRQKLPVLTLPRLLAAAGYQTAGVGDWAAADLAKFDFGFQQTDVAPDQWNLKYLLRQGPKDIRLFLSLFTHNRFGKTFLPEIYYLAGVPLTKEVGKNARSVIKKLAENGQPFFVNVFIASTHGPFGSPYPYYKMYTDPAYRGESLFSMSGLSSPEEIVKRQEQGKHLFDIQQIIDLYDGAVTSFDDEVGRIVAYLKASNLHKNTIVIIYSDHGVDLFEAETWGQGNILSDYSYRVPLVITDPRVASGTNIARTVSTVDIAPTILELTGLKPPDAMQGRSLIPVMHALDSASGRLAFAETGVWLAKNIPGLPENRIRYPAILDLLEIKDKSTGTLSIKPEHMDAVIKAKARMVREDRWQLQYFPVTNSGVYSLYDVFADPAMHHDVAGEYPEIVGRLKERLIAWLHQETEISD